MNSILLVACIGMITGFFILFSISPMDFTENIFKSLLSKPRSIKDEINETTYRKKASFFKREVAEIQSILKFTGREQYFPMLCAISLLLCAVGIAIALVLGNLFIIPVFGVGFMFIPFWYIRLTQTHFKKISVAS